MKKASSDAGFFVGLGGEEEDRTPDLVIANDALSQLSYPRFVFSHGPLPEAQAVWVLM